MPHIHLPNIIEGVKFKDGIEIVAANTAPHPKPPPGPIMPSPTFGNSSLDRRIKVIWIYVLASSAPIPVRVEWFIARYRGCIGR